MQFLVHSYSYGDYGNASHKKSSFIGVDNIYPEREDTDELSVVPPYKKKRPSN